MESRARAMSFSSTPQADLPINSTWISSRSCSRWMTTPESENDWGYGADLCAMEEDEAGTSNGECLVYSLTTPRLPNSSVRSLAGMNGTNNYLNIHHYVAPARRAQRNFAGDLRGLA